MKKLLQLIFIGLLILSCNNKNKAETKTFEKAEMELKNYTEEERTKEFQYLKSNIFNGLENLNDGFDSESIYYFSESDFEIVLDRIEKNGIAIFGIEPWLNKYFYDVLSFEDYKTVANDPKWYRKAFTEFKNREKNLMYSASYQVPKKLLAE
ncbi:hypothetical protein FDT66_11270 [Polaribacter aestuariivivens]|uniref:Uncharacterized protein n=1 Tax=Polaribacter aestuariivivens TaxID=2304626 RepID=A0A5S3N302_9FLAO|nr:hypothetical protein [Polaribacter aestuariivivens]TMM29685.1 hypothetical protein FDT66_11270 [Polaribacter aestuariivivens]